MREASPAPVGLGRVEVGSEEVAAPGWMVYD